MVLQFRKERSSGMMSPLSPQRVLLSRVQRVQGTPARREPGRIVGARRECRGAFRAYVDLERACRSRRCLPCETRVEDAGRGRSTID